MASDKLTIDKTENKDKDSQLQKVVDKDLEHLREEKRKEKLRDYYDAEKIAYAIVDIIRLYPDAVKNPDGTYDEIAIQRLLLDPTNLENPIAWDKRREEFLERNPELIPNVSKNKITYDVSSKAGEMGLYYTYHSGSLVKWDMPEVFGKIPFVKKYDRLNKSTKIIGSFIGQLNDQIESGGRVSDSFFSDFLKSREPTSDSSSKDETKTPDPKDPFNTGSSGDEDPSTSSGDDMALSTFEETLFKTASEANDIIDRLKDLYNEVYDGRGISSAQERSEPGWKPSYLDKQFDLRVMDIEEQSKSRNRALILTMAGIDLRGEMEEARKLISFKTKELRDIGHDPDGFRRTQYQKQSQFLLQSFGLLMQIAPNAFGAKYGITQNAWALSNGIRTGSLPNLSNVGSQYPGINTPSLIEETDEAGEKNV